MTKTSAFLIAASSILLDACGADVHPYEGKIIEGLQCVSDDACETGYCARTDDARMKGAGARVCMEPTCDDGVFDGVETWIDCGNYSVSGCLPCGPDGRCRIDDDCAPPLRCVGGFCAGCNDVVLDGDETAVDCGGSCGPCPPGKSCRVGGDCRSGTCTNSVCTK